MIKNKGLIMFDMFLNPSFKMTTSFANVGRTAATTTVCSYHVTYTFQSESTLYSCLNVKELLA